MKGEANNCTYTIHFFLQIFNLSFKGKINLLYLFKRDAILFDILYYFSFINRDIYVCHWSVNKPSPKCCPLFCNTFSSHVSGEHVPGTCFEIRSINVSVFTFQRSCPKLWPPIARNVLKSKQKILRRWSSSWSRKSHSCGTNSWTSTTLKRNTELNTRRKWRSWVQQLIKHNYSNIGDSTL